MTCLAHTWLYHIELQSIVSNNHGRPDISYNHECYVSRVHKGQAGKSKHDVAVSLG